jgi:hypothetical protein
MTSVLTSWKEIAQYVSKGVRTVQRWERELGFPVRRTKRGTKSIVLAIPGEIDVWVQSQQFTDGQLDSVESERTTPIPSSEGASIKKSGASTPSRIRTIKCARESKVPGSDHQADSSPLAWEKLKEYRFRIARIKLPAP